MASPHTVHRFETLTATQVTAVSALAADARANDGVGALNEASELRLRASARPDGADAPTDDRPVVHLVVGDGDDPAGYAQVSAPGGPDAEAELVVHPTRRRAGRGTALLAAVQEVAGPHVRVWAHGDLPGAVALARSAGFVPVRGLWRMRRDMTVPLAPGVLPDGVTLRTFVPGQDDEAWLAVNAAAFVDHPEQGRWTAADLQARMAEDWFDPEGFFLAVDADSGELLGYHWTKVAGDVGEVYVVGVSPAAQGRRVGSALTLAGLHHLRDRGLAVVDLYVESDNAPALAVYTRLGFARAAVDVMYARRPD